MENNLKTTITVRGPKFCEVCKNTCREGSYRDAEGEPKRYFCSEKCARSYFEQQWYEGTSGAVAEGADYLNIPYDDEMWEEDRVIYLDSVNVIVPMSQTGAK